MTTWQPGTTTRAAGRQVLLSSNQLLQAGGGHRLWSLKGQAKSTIPHKGGGHTKGPGYSKENSVVVHLLHAKVLEGVDGDLTNLSSAMRLPEGLDLLLSRRDLLRHSGAQIRGVDRVAGAEARICHSRHQLLLALEHPGEGLPEESHGAAPPC